MHFTIWRSHFRLDVSLQWRNNEHNGVSNHRRFDYLLNRLFRRTSRKTSKLRVTRLCGGEFTGDRRIATHEGPVTRKMFSFDDVFMINTPCLRKHFWQLVVLIHIPAYMNSSTPHPPPTTPNPPPPQPPTPTPTPNPPPPPPTHTPNPQPHPTPNPPHPTPLVPQIRVSELGQHRFGKWLVACSAPSHYLNQYSLIVNWSLGNKLQWNSIRLLKFHS